MEEFKSAEEKNPTKETEITEEDKKELVELMGKIKENRYFKVLNEKILKPLYLEMTDPFSPDSFSQRYVAPTAKEGLEEIKKVFPSQKENKQ